MRRSSNPLAACAVAATVLAACAAEAPSPARSSTASPGTEIAVPEPGLLLLHAAPGSERVLARVGPRTEFGSPTRLAVVGQTRDWLAVISSKLGNRMRGFVLRSDVSLVHDPFSVEIDRSARQLTVRQNGVVLRRFGVAIGAAATPTPLGRFAVTDKLANFMPALYGCCSLALSGRQTQPTPGWSGGDRLAIHVGEGIGGAVSNGCVRGSTSDLRFLMRVLPLGTQVLVHP